MNSERKGAVDVIYVFCVDWAGNEKVREKVIFDFSCIVSGLSTIDTHDFTLDCLKQSVSPNFEQKHPEAQRYLMRWEENVLGFLPSDTFVRQPTVI